MKNNIILWTTKLFNLAKLKKIENCSAVKVKNTPWVTMNLWLRLRSVLDKWPDRLWIIIIIRIFCVKCLCDFLTQTWVHNTSAESTRDTVNKKPHVNNCAIYRQRSSFHSVQYKYGLARPSELINSTASGVDVCLTSVIRAALFHIPSGIHMFSSDVFYACAETGRLNACAL